MNIPAKVACPDGIPYDELHESGGLGCLKIFLKINSLVPEHIVIHIETAIYFRFHVVNAFKIKYGISNIAIADQIDISRLTR